MFWVGQALYHESKGARLLARFRTCPSQTLAMLHSADSAEKAAANVIKLSLDFMRGFQPTLDSQTQAIDP